LGATRKLTRKQDAFATLVAGGTHPSDAYRQTYGTATLKAETIRVESSKLVHNPTIAIRIQELRAPALERIKKNIEVNAESSLLANAAIAFSDVGKLFNKEGHLLHPHDMDPQTRAAVASIKTKRIELSNDGDGNRKGTVVIDEVKFWDKGAALDRFFKHFGAYEKDNRQKTGNFLDSLPREVAKMIVERLRVLSGPAGG
jgi:phage terminase small subunit